MKKAIIAMSGGVDSSVAALLTLQKEYECIGATMKLYETGDIVCSDKTCCAADDVEDARQVAAKLGIPYYVFNFCADFQKEVIERFVCSYETGATPNPCIECNKHLKFERLFDKMYELGYDYVVTGHYARIEYDENTGRYLLKKAKDISKDQSYVLYSLSQEQLAHILFPLGEIEEKSVTRSIAEENGFINAKKSESQDICFVPDGDYAAFIERYRGKAYPHGNFVDTEGNILGEHKGIIRYTVGQRKGLGFGGGPWFVVKKNIKRNILFVSHGYDPEKVYKDHIRMNDFHFITENPWEGTLATDIPITFKIRHTPEYLKGTIRQEDDGSWFIQAEEKIHGVAPGQFCVVYDKHHHLCYGSGEIS